jgi:hypothetical protein
MSECIIIFLSGGIGNQLFQYSAGLAVMSKLGGTLWLAPCEMNKHSGRDYRSRLYIRAKSIGPDGAPGEVDVEKKQISPFEVWSPDHYSSIKSVSLRGYYQYLPAIESQIPLVRDDLFSRLSDIRSLMREKYRIHNARQTSFIHVRRGDYLTSDPNVFFVQQESYFIPAIQAINQHTLGNRRWLVVSDDIGWCREQSWLRDYEIIDEPDELHGLMVMGLCQAGAVISNSTFGWWGAVLGCGEVGSPVVYPAKWIGNENPDLFFPNWTRMG